MNIYRGLPEATKALARALTSRYYCLSFLGRREEALTAITEAVDNLRPDDDKLVYTLEAQAGCARELGRNEVALAAFTDAVMVRRVRREQWLPTDPAAKHQESGHRGRTQGGACQPF